MQGYLLRSSIAKLILGTQVGVWIVGSSLVRNAFVAAKKRPGGIHLALNHRFGIGHTF
jgi:hypothetical protein